MIVTVTVTDCLYISATCVKQRVQLDKITVANRPIAQGELELVPKQQEPSEMYTCKISARDEGSLSALVSVQLYSGG